MTQADRSRPLDPEQVMADELEVFKNTDADLAWLRLLASLRLARVVHAAVRLGVIDALRESSRSARDVARATETDESAVYRLLRALAAAGVVAEPSEGRFGLTPTGRLLVSQGKPSFAGALLDFFDPELVAQDGLVRTVATGRPAFEEKHGLPFYAYLERRAAAGGARFDASMNTGAGLRAQALVAAADLSGAGTIVDVGGGEGLLVATVLAAHPHPRGVVFERPDAAARARVRLEEVGLASRCQVVAGDFFSSVPAGGDVYVLSFVLHNWDDDRAVALLSRCRAAMADDAVLLLVEQVRVPADEASIVEYFSLTTLEIVGGRERTEEEFREVLVAAGFTLTRVSLPAGQPFSVLEARPVRPSARLESRS